MLELFIKKDGSVDLWWFVYRVFLWSHKNHCHLLYSFQTGEIHRQKPSSVLSPAGKWIYQVNSPVLHTVLLGFDSNDGFIMQ